MTDDNNNKKIPKVVAIAHDAPVVAPGNDPLHEELNVVRLEGRYFCFDRHEAKRRNGKYRYIDENGSRETIIDVDPRVGHPSILTYRLLQAIFRKVTLEGRPYPDVVSFGMRELSRLVGREAWGGRHSKEIYEAIRQLRRTEVHLVIRKGELFESREFSLVIESGFVGAGDATDPAHLHAVAIRLHPVIMDSMRAGHYAIFNWERISSLEPLSCALYKRLYFHLSNLFENSHGRKSLRFEKSYADICAEWLGGLKPERYKSRIEQQLRPHLKELQRVGLVRSVAIERMADGTSFKLVFVPGTGFFEDYETFYLGSRARVLQFQQAADAANISGPLALTAYFYKRLLKIDSLEETIHSEKDIQCAQHLIKQFGEEGARDLFDFTLEQAPLTNFNIRTIHAVRSFVPQWQAEQTKRLKRLESQKAEERQRREDQLRREYDEYCNTLVHRYLEQASEAEVEEIRQAAEDETKNSPPVLVTMNRRMAERRIVRLRCDTPSFEIWLDNRG